MGFAFTANKIISFFFSAYGPDILLIATFVSQLVLAIFLYYFVGLDPNQVFKRNPFKVTGNGTE